MHNFFSTFFSVTGGCIEHGAGSGPEQAKFEKRSTSPRPSAERRPRNHFAAPAPQNAESLAGALLRALMREETFTERRAPDPARIQLGSQRARAGGRRSTANLSGSNQFKYKNLQNQFLRRENRFQRLDK